MNLTGLTVRYFTACQSGTFVFDNIRTNAIELLSGGIPSGRELRIGLTGITGNSSWYFSFCNGKMYDPEGRWFGGYDESDVNSISGNFSPSGYAYFLNGELISSIGSRTNQTFHGWYSESFSGATGQADISVYSANIPCSLTFRSGFYVSGTWSGSFGHQNIGPVVIRSGELRLPDSVYFALTGSGLDFRTGTNIVPTGGYRTVLLRHTGTMDRTGLYTVGVRIHTDFGWKDFTISGSGVPISSGEIGNSLSPSSGWNIVSTGSGFTGTNEWLFSTSYIGHNGTEQAKPVYTELSYLSGPTGTFTWVTGVTITNSGSSYTSQPYVLVTPTGMGYPMASGRGLLGTGPTATGITGVQWNQSGIYTGVTAGYSISISDGGGSAAAMTPLWGLAYTKTFTGQFSLLTGFFGESGSIASGVTMTNYDARLIMPTTETVLSMTVNYVGTSDTAQTQYMIKASGLPDSLSSISIYSGIGLGYKE